MQIIFQCMENVLKKISDAIRDCNCLDLVNNFNYNPKKGFATAQIESGSIYAWEKIKEAVEKNIDLQKYSIKIKKSLELFVYDLYISKH